MYIPASKIVFRLYIVDLSGHPREAYGMSLSPTVASRERNLSLRGSLGTAVPVANQRNQGAHICSVGLVDRNL